MQHTGKCQRPVSSVWGSPWWCQLSGSASRPVYYHYSPAHIQGKARTVLREHILGWRALNKAINSPRGLDRYPTAPRSTWDGSHKGKTTANRWIWFYERDNMPTHVKDSSHGWESFGIFSGFVFWQWYCCLVEERRGYFEWEPKCSGCFS